MRWRRQEAHFFLQELRSRKRKRRRRRRTKVVFIRCRNLANPANQRCTGSSLFASTRGVQIESVWQPRVPPSAKVPGEITESEILSSARMKPRPSIHSSLLHPRLPIRPPTPLPPPPRLPPPPPPCDRVFHWYLSLLLASCSIFRSLDAGTVPPRALLHFLCCAASFMSRPIRIPTIVISADRVSRVYRMDSGAFVACPATVEERERG
ncbi:hypothetical protein E2C01_053210 [Portunus trituberculatus]|uniref:Uncharacterized protein n=1 Tax=Portunus trituberculatus TaxID=210409 RepID=A0A5B7GRE3_PORTR|nr:hypothetical protein [Portunus trituberculatus]